MDIKQQDLIRFWTWCGFIKNNVWYIGNTLESPDKKVTLTINTLNSSITLDYLFKYAIPKLQEEGYSITLIAYERNEFGVGIFDEIHGVSAAEINRCDSPVEALYNAVIQVINKEAE
jgi:hypothetical protein